MTILSSYMASFCSSATAPEMCARLGAADSLGERNYSYRQSGNRQYCVADREVTDIIQSKETDGKELLLRLFATRTLYRAYQSSQCFAVMHCCFDLSIFTFEP